MIFGWRLTNKPLHVESEEVKELHKLLKDEQETRKSAAIEAKQAKLKLELEIEKAEKIEKDRNKNQKITYAKAAINTLKAAERYLEIQQSLVNSPVRRAEYEAVIVKKVEAVRNMGFDVKDISKSISQIEKIASGN